MVIVRYLLITLAIILGSVIYIVILLAPVVSIFYILVTIGCEQGLAVILTMMITCLWSTILPSILDSFGR